MKIKAEEWVRVVGRGWIAIVNNPKESDTIPFSCGDKVNIDGNVYTLAGVEYCHKGFPPYHKGTPLGLLIRGDKL